MSVIWSDLEVLEKKHNLVLFKHRCSFHVDMLLFTHQVLSWTAGEIHPTSRPVDGFISISYSGLFPACFFLLLTQSMDVFYNRLLCDAIFSDIQNEICVLMAYTVL